MFRAFNVGDTVQIKSGGPPMTVQSIDREGVVCTWFWQGVMYSENFPPSMLSPYSGDAVVAVSGTGRRFL